jgi:putative ABC transport system permease protein
MPAVAMQPPSPPDYSHSISFGGRAGRILDQTSKIIVRRFVHHPWRAFVSVAGISAGMALSVSMHSLMSSFNSTMNLTFEVMDRSDLTLTFAEPLSETVVHELESMNGVIEVEPSRNVPVIFHHGRRSWRGTVTGLVASPELYRVLDVDQNPAYVRADGVLLGRALADILDVRPGGVLRLDVREGRCPTVEIPVAGVVDTFIGAPAFFELDQLNRVLREPKRVSCAYLRIDSHRKDELFRQFKQMPAIAGVSLKQETRDSLQELLDSGAGAMRFIMAAIAAVITFGIVYNSARIAFAEMASDLAILRVLGFSRGETASVLLGELTLMTLMAIPLGMALGIYLNHIIATGFSNDIYQIPALVMPESHAIAAITVIASAFASGWFVRRDVINLDFLAAIKTRV